MAICLSNNKKLIQHPSEMFIEQGVFQNHLGSLLKNRSLDPIPKNSGSLDLG